MLAIAGKSLEIPMVWRSLRTGMEAHGTMGACKEQRKYKRREREPSQRSLTTANNIRYLSVSVRTQAAQGSCGVDIARENCGSFHC